MDLYLMRHGIAENRRTWKGPDCDRPLTGRGRQRTRAVLSALIEEFEIRVEAVWSSPHVRAWQTARIAGDLLQAPLVRCPQLVCGADLHALAAAMRRTAPPFRLMLVGHEPDLGVLLGALLGEAAARPFKKAGVAYCRGEFKRGGMDLRWHFRPRDLLPR